jgi:hypothetical protein
MKMTVSQDVAPCSMAEVYQSFRGVLITLMMEAANTSETSVKYQITRHKIPEKSNFRWLLFPFVLGCVLFLGKHIL